MVVEDGGGGDDDYSCFLGDGIDCVCVFTACFTTARQTYTVDVLDNSLEFYEYRDDGSSPL